MWTGVGVSHNWSLNVFVLQRQRKELRVMSSWWLMVMEKGWKSRRFKASSGNREGQKGPTITLGP